MNEIKNFILVSLLYLFFLNLHLFAFPLAYFLRLHKRECSFHYSLQEIKNKQTPEYYFYA